MYRYLLLLLVLSRNRLSHKYCVPCSCVHFGMMEVAAEQCTETESGCVLIGWDEESSIFEFPRKVYDSFAEFEKSCLPVRFAALHTCCPTSAILKIMRPIMLALTDKRTRLRTIVHDVPVSQICDVLSAYGILREMLPTEMGGEVKLNQAEWIADRRAVELQEIG